MEDVRNFLTDCQVRWTKGKKSWHHQIVMIKRFHVNRKKLKMKRFDLHKMSHRYNPEESK